MLRGIFVGVQEKQNTRGVFQLLIIIIIIVIRVHHQRNEKIHHSKGNIIVGIVAVVVERCFDDNRIIS
jgi:hypothetical protein